MNALTRLMIFVVSLLIALSTWTAWLALGDPISQTKWDSIGQGMTRDEVVKILGAPDSLDGDQLEYSGLLNAGWVELVFDESGVLIRKHDESVFGSLR
jgi:hypothetical protein